MLREEMQFMWLYQSRDTEIGQQRHGATCWAQPTFLFSHHDTPVESVVSPLESVVSPHIHKGLHRSPLTHLG
jgi:hypothetical protein